MTKLKDLLTEEEIKEFKRSGLIGYNINLDIFDKEPKKLTWFELSKLSPIINTETIKNRSCLAAAAINILTDRAIENKLPIF